MNRIKVKRSKLLRSLVRGGADRRQMVRQLSRVEHLHSPDASITGAFTWALSPQGNDYWRSVARKYAGCKW